MRTARHKMPQMGFTLRHRLVHLPPSQWVEVYDDAGRDVGLHRDVESYFKNLLSAASEMQLQAVNPSAGQAAWVAGQDEEFQTLVHKLAQHQQYVARMQEKDPSTLRYVWQKKGNRHRLNLG